MSSISPSNNRDKLKLIGGAQLFFRNGARTPFHLLPNLDEVIYDKELHLNHFKPADCEIKMLLKDNEETISERVFIGEHNIRKLNEGAAFSGQLTAIYLIVKENFLPKIYDPSLVYTRSTFIDRTIHSARCFLAGLFSNENEKIQTTSPFKIEIHSWINETLYPNPRIYPLLEKRLKPKELYELLHDEHDFKKARKNFLEKINLSEYEHGFVELHDDIKSREDKTIKQKNIFY